MFVGYMVLVTNALYNYNCVQVLVYVLQYRYVCRWSTCMLATYYTSSSGSVGNFAGGVMLSLSLGLK